MKLENLLGSRAIRLFPVHKAAGGRLSGAALARAIEDRYGFLQGPRTVEDYDPLKGVAFLHGRIRDQPLIDKFTIFNDGVVCDTKVDTVAADFFIDDVIKWAQEENGSTFEGVSDRRRLYMSNIEFSMDVDISHALHGFEAFCQKLTSKFQDYKQVAPSFGPSRIGFHGDLTTLPGGVGPPAFIVERRDEQPYSAGKYFSTAPLSTPDHLEMLSELESLFKAMARDQA